MAMNTVIQEKRRELGMTQEQVAEHMGVSIPAVSKWETGQTCPDTTLLPRLARLLKVDLNTLFSFHEDLTGEEIQEICNTVREAGQAEGVKAAFQQARQYRQEYPHCDELLLSMTYTVEAIANNAGLSQEELAEYQACINSALEELAQSSRTEISNAANFMLTNKFIRQGKLEQAQRVLDRMPDKQSVTQEIADKLMLQVSIYQQQAKFEEAAKELEYALFTAATRVQTLLSLYTSLEMTAGKLDHAQAVAAKGTAFVELFQLWEYNRYVNEYQIALKKEDSAAVLLLLRKLLNALCQPWSTKNSVLFRNVDWNITPDQQNIILANLLGSLEQDAEYEFLRKEPEFSALLQEFRA